MKNCIDVTFEYLDKATLGDSICIKKWALHPPALTGRGPALFKHTIANCLVESKSDFKFIAVAEPQGENHE